jgi:hypothetical protein
VLAKDKFERNDDSGKDARLITTLDTVVGGAACWVATAVRLLVLVVASSS